MEINTSFLSPPRKESSDLASIFNGVESIGVTAFENVTIQENQSFRIKLGSHYLYSVSIRIATSAVMTSNASIFYLDNSPAYTKSLFGKMQDIDGGGAYLAYKYANLNSWKNGGNVSIPTGNYIVTSVFIA